MIDFINNAETRRIAHIVAKHFADSSWKVINTERSHEPILQVSKSSISFFIKCVDITTTNFIGVSRFIDRLEQFAREYRSRSGEVIVYVVSQPLGGVDTTRLPAHGIALFTIAELSMLTDVELTYGRTFGSLDDRMKRVVQGCIELCIALSEAAADADNVEEAKRWLDLNLDGVRSVLETRYKLVELLSRDGRTEEAKLVARDGIDISGYNLRLLNQLHALEKKTGNTVASHELQQRIVGASYVRPSLEAILAKQNPQTGDKPLAEAPGLRDGAAKHSTVRGLLARLFYLRNRHVEERYDA